MKQIAAYSLVALMSLPAAPAVMAQESSDPSEMSEGLDLLGEGLKLLMDGLSDEVEGLAQGMEPALRELAGQVGPAMQELLELVDDFNAYHLPEMLPNGDIIIRRKLPGEIEPEPEGEIEI